MGARAVLREFCETMTDTNERRLAVWKGFSGTLHYQLVLTMRQSEGNFSKKRLPGGQRPFPG
jgi:hypothetical protein